MKPPTLKEGLVVGGLTLLMYAFLVLTFLTGCAHLNRNAVSKITLKTYAGRPDGMVACQTWEDSHGVKATFVFTDPSGQGLCDKWTNSLTGGTSWFMLAPFSMIVDSNLVPAIAAGGTAVGNIVGAAVKTAVKP